MATLTDDSLIVQYVSTVKAKAFRAWNQLTENERGNAIANAAADALVVCGAPRPTPDVAVLNSDYNGFFDFQGWSLKFSESMFGGWMDHGNVHPYFVNTLEIVYHEARHCEQWWCMARLHAAGRKPAELVQELGIPLHVASIACKNPMKSSEAGADPRPQLTKKWFESVYGVDDGMQKVVSLGTLALKRTQQASKPVSMNDFDTQCHQEYKGNLPEEVDAWAVQQLVRAKF